jgi:hypothetical protein
MTKSLDIRTRVATATHVADSKYNLALHWQRIVHLSLQSRHQHQTDIALSQSRHLFLECEQIYITVYGREHSETSDGYSKAS